MVYVGLLKHKFHLVKVVIHTRVKQLFGLGD